MVLVKILVEIDPLPMRGSLVMTMAMISPSRREVSPAEQLYQSPRLVELFCRGHFPPGGGNHRHRHHQRSSHREGVNLHQYLHQHHLLSNPSSSLVSNLCPKASDWYLWVASSVDYSL